MKMILVKFFFPFFGIHWDSGSPFYLLLTAAIPSVAKEAEKILQGSLIEKSTFLEMNICVLRNFLLEILFVWGSGVGYKIMVSEDKIQLWWPKDQCRFYF